MKLKTAQSLIRAVQQGALLLALIVCVLIPSQLFAQANTLWVTLHDVGGVALAGISIIVRAEDGQELARQATGSDGVAHFGGLPEVVRVLVEGQPRGGPRLYQLGDDERGVRLDLGQAQGPPFLDLRVERDGLVLPDPTTMLTLEEGGPVVEDEMLLPTAAIATPAPLPTISIARETGVVSTDEGPGPGQPRPSHWVPLVTVLIIAIAAGVMRLLQHRRDAR